LHCLREGFVLFVHTDWLGDFFQWWYPVIPVRFVLVSGGATDESTPINRGLSKWAEVDNSKKIIHWYAQSCDSSPNPKFFSCIMIGVEDENHFSDVRKQTGLEILTTDFLDDLVVTKVPPKGRLIRPLGSFNTSYDILVPAFNMGTHPSRASVWNSLCGGAHHYGKQHRLHTNSLNVTCLCLGKTDPREMFTLTKNSKFVASPRGKCPDAHRTWETLYLGSFPLVETSPLDDMYNDLPVMIVPSFDNITQEMLRDVSERLLKTAWNFDQLRASNWGHVFGNHSYTRYNYETEPVLLKQYSDETIERLGLKEGMMIKGDKFIRWTIKNSTRCWIDTVEMAYKYDWDFRDAKTISALELNWILIGPRVTSW
jgi:hypothetical protein